MDWKNPPEKTREANFECLRVTAMLMVTVLHALGHGGVLEQYAFGTAGDCLFWLIEALCFVAVDVFVLITGYFLSASRVKASRLLKFMLQVETCSLLCLAFSQFALHRQIGLKDVVRAVFPLTGKEYWFASAYAVLLVLVPLLNRMIRAMDQRAHGFALVLLTGLFSVVPSFAFWSRELLTEGKDFVWFIVLYMTAAYIRLYGKAPARRRDTLKWLAGYIILAGSAFLSRMVIGGVTLRLFGRVREERLFYANHSILLFPAAVCLFMAFRGIKTGNVPWRKAVLLLGKGCFGVYLMTDHPLIRSWLWETIGLSNIAAVSLPKTCAAVALAVLCLFFAGCAFELLREKIMRLLRYERFLRKADDFVSAMANMKPFDQKEAH